MPRRKTKPADASQSELLDVTARLRTAPCVPALREAVKAWNYYIEFSKCSPKTADEECAFAFKRRAELSKLSKNY